MVINCKNNNAAAPARAGRRRPAREAPPAPIPAPPARKKGKYTAHARKWLISSFIYRFAAPISNYPSQ